jgi:hypothetical protein
MNTVVPWQLQPKLIYFNFLKFCKKQKSLFCQIIQNLWSDSKPSPLQYSTGSCEQSNHEDN